MLGENKLKMWREEDREMQKNEEKVEEQIRLLKKERNRQRVEPQRRDPKAKRQKLDDDGRNMPEIKDRKPWKIPEPEKRKMQEEEEIDPGSSKRLREDDIRSFMNRENPALVSGLIDLTSGGCLVADSDSLCPITAKDVDGGKSEERSGEVHS